MGTLNKLNQLLKKAYSPYSKVNVAAIIITNDGREYSGVNIENASFSATICAERVAIFSAINNGVKKGEFKELHLTSNTKNKLYPCGICRQVMTEFFDQDTNIIIWHNKEKEIIKLKQLIPFAVKEEHLK